MRHLPGWTIFELDFMPGLRESLRQMYRAFLELMCRAYLCERPHSHQHYRVPTGLFGSELLEIKRQHLLTLPRRLCDLFRSEFERVYHVCGRKGEPDEPNGRKLHHVHE